MKRLAMVLVLVSACSSDSGSGNEFAATYCAKAFECKSTYPGTPADFMMSYGASESACATQSTMAPPAYKAAFDASVAAGRIALPSQADDDACLAFIDGLTCDTTDMGIWGFLSFPASCSPVGKVPLGGACTFWRDDTGMDIDIGDCADTHYCAPETSTCT